MLNYGIIKEVVNYSKRLGQKISKKFTYSITTNGTLIDSEIENFLLQNRIETQISVDGKKEQHDLNRFFNNGEGSYDLIMKNTLSLRKKGYLSARATISKDNINILDVFKHLSSLGFTSIPIAPAQNLLTAEDYDVLNKEMTKTVLYIADLLYDKNINEAKKMVVLYNSLLKIRNGGVRHLPCGVGRNIYAIDIDGLIYPCHRFVGNKEYILGDIYNGVKNRNKFLESIDINNHMQCLNCWARNLCLGGCPNENVENSGRIDKSTKKNCTFTKNMYENLIRLYIRMSDEERQLLDS